MTPIFNATQSAGLAATAFAMVACVAAAKTPWRFLAVFHAALFLEVLLGLRHQIHALAGRGLMAEALYGERRPMQIALLAGLLVAGVLILWFAGRQKRLPAKVGILSSGMLAALFVVETISLHAIDAVLYRRIGPLMIIGFIWAALCAITILAALADRSAKDRRKRRRA
jgi:hypothetical protein